LVAFNLAAKAPEVGEASALFLFCEIKKTSQPQGSCTSEVVQIMKLMSSISASIVFMRPIKSLLVLVFARAFGNAVSAVSPWDRGTAPRRWLGNRWQFVDADQK
jgi:hypothetical protein